MLKEFKEFAMRGNVLDLAIGLVLGSAFGAIVTSLVEDVIMPLISLVMGGVDFQNWFVALDGSDYATLAAAKEAGAATINYGVLINTIINFIFIAFAVFLMVKGINKMRRPEEAPAATKECPHCKSEIAIDATRCPHCTSELV